MTINNHSGTDKGNELNNNKSIVETPKKKGDFKKKIERFGPLFLFLPIIILMTSDASLLLTNQVQLIIHFNIESGLAFTGIIIAGSLISHAFAMVVFGYWADKHSRKKALIIGGLLWVIGDLMTYLSINEYMLLFFRMMASAGTGVSAPVTMSLLSDIFSTEKRGKSFAYWGLATTVGELGGGSIGLLFNPLLDIEFPDHIVELPDKINFITLNFSETAINAWRIPFLFMFFIGIVFIILLFFVKEPKRGSRETILQSVLENEDIDYAKSYQIKKTDLKFIYTRKSNFWLIINFVDCIFSGLIMGFLITWLTLEIQLEFDLENIFIALPLLLPVLIAFIAGPIISTKIGDKKYNSGDYAGRVKIAIICGIVQIPFLIVGFFFAPNFSNNTFLKGAINLSENIGGFMAILAVMGIILSIGLGFWLGVGPNWYASIIDVNLPEHRGTMIAMASFMDSIGRAIGSGLGGLIIEIFILQNSIAPITDTLIFSILTVGVISAILWLPILKYCEKDFKEIIDTLQERAKKLEKQK